MNITEYNNTLAKLRDSVIQDIYKIVEEKREIIFEDDNIYIEEYTDWDGEYLSLEKLKWHNNKVWVTIHYSGQILLETFDVDDLLIILKNI